MFYRSIVTSLALCLPGAAWSAVECAPLSATFYEDARADTVSACVTSQNVQDRDGDGNTPLHLAVVSSPDTDVIRYLLALGADPASLNAAGHMPVHRLAASGSVPGHVAALKTWGADLNARIGTDVCSRPMRTCAASALTVVAARPDALPLMRAFLAAGADVTAEDGSGRTALLEAARMSGVDAVELLLAAGADLEDVDFKDFTALHLAALRGPDPDLAEPSDRALVQYLLDMGADTASKTDVGVTPLMFAAAYTDDAGIWQILARATDSDSYCEPDEKERTIRDLFDANPNLERDSMYWEIVQQCG